MKKIMIIAVMVSTMLMPAQMMAKNNKNNAKARVENRMDFKVEAKRNDWKDKKFNKVKPNMRNDKKFTNKKPMKKPNRVVINRPPAPRLAPRPRPIPVPAPRRIYVNNCYNNDVVEAAATIVGIAALASLIAD